MINKYIKRGAMALGAIAMVASANAQGAYVDVTNQYLKDVTYIPGWQGVIGEVGDGVGGVFNGAFRLYQIVPNAPAGEYTLTCNAAYRCGNNDFAKANMPGNADLHKAFIFIGNAKKAVEGLFDNNTVAPNSLGEASTAFSEGKYANSVKVNHEGGDLVFGIANTGCYHDEWTCFDNFKLTGPNGEITVENGDFSTGIDSKRSWDNKNSDGGEKTPDIQKDGSGGGDYRKCGGSPYKYGQQVELPAGKYRFGMLTFHRYGTEVDADGNNYNHKWPCDKVNAYGYKGRTTKDWYVANDYDAQTDYDHAYIFMSKNETCPNTLKWSEDLGDLTENQDIRVRIKDCWEICNGDLNAMPHNNPVRVEGNKEGDWQDVIPYETVNKLIYRNDSGSEREAAAAFVANPEKWYQYVEFELTAPTKVWLGMGKDSNTGDGYWHPWADITLKKFDASASGIGDIAVDNDENAPVEYYNLQGVRVAEPENGLYIVKQGKKVTKQVIRK